MMLKKITLIIPTYNRHHYLTRLLEYYKDCKFTIFVADSTKQIYEFKDNYNINYFHYPDWPPVKKLAKVFQKVETSYVFMCADDDFIIPEAIEKCIDFLENNHDYSSAQGNYVSFKKNKKILFRLRPSLFQLLKNYDINANTPEERLKQSMSSYMHLFYSVHRVKNLIDIVKLPKQYEIEYFGGFYELTIAMISVINGKHKVLPFFYCAREIQLSSARTRIPPILSVINDPKMKHDLKFIYDSISNHLAITNNSTLKEAEVHVLEAIYCYVNSLINQRDNSITNSIINMVFYPISLVMLALFPKIYSNIQNKEILMITKESTERDPNFNKIIQLINDFPNCTIQKTFKMRFSELSNLFSSLIFRNLTKNIMRKRKKKLMLLNHT